MSDDEKSGGKSSSKGAAKTYEERLLRINQIAHPMASKKLTKKIHKLVKKGSGAKIIRRGVKEVVKGLKKNEKGICIIAGDIFPVDVISHISSYCEDKDVPYIYVPSKHDLGAAASVKRPTSVVFVNSKKSFDEKELLDKVVKEIKSESSD